VFFFFGERGVKLLPFKSNYVIGLAKIHNKVGVVL